MTQTVLVVGYGPGISTAVAEKFGGDGFSVALVARNEARLSAGVESLRQKGITAAAFPADARDPAAMRTVVEKARATLGPLTVVLWTAYGGEAIDLLAADAAALHDIFDVAVVGLLTTIRAALPDLRQTKGAVLIANGGFGDVDPKTDAYVVKTGAMGLALGDAAKDKLVGLLSERLKSEGVYVGEVLVAGPIKGTAIEKLGFGKELGPAIDPVSIADTFERLLRRRDEIRARVRPC